MEKQNYVEGMAAVMRLRFLYIVQTYSNENKGICNIIFPALFETIFRHERDSPYCQFKGFCSYFLIVHTPIIGNYI